MNAPALEVQGLHAGYGSIQVLRDISMTVEQGAVTTLLGANGAGKSTTLRAICGLIKSRGTVRFGGDALRSLTPENVARRKVAHIPEGRGTFPHLTVEENLRVGAILRPRAAVTDSMARWLDFFPRLAERRTQLAGSLSGGEQQMLAIGRAMMLEPSLLLLDEPSMGLAPKITQNLFAQLQELNRTERLSVLVVEQNANLALEIADHAYVLESGRITLSGPAAELMTDDRVRKAYLHV
jgi:branched-chain amino acid transport system ATP-binding protein